MKRRIIAMALALSLLIGSAIRPQRANAVAVTATVVAASAAAILTACGVSYWAATQTDAVDYISGKLEDYLTSIEVEETPADWLGISANAQPFTVIAGGALRFSSAVANKLLGFVRWFQQEEGLESGGDVVSNAVALNPTVGYSHKTQGSITVYATGADTLRISLSGVIYESNNNVTCFSVPWNQDYKSTNVYLLDYTDNIGLKWTADAATSIGYIGRTLYNSSLKTLTVNKYSSTQYLTIKIETNGGGTNGLSGYAEFRLENYELYDEPTAIITPSAMVNIPADVEEDTTFDLTTTADISSTDDVDTASEAIIEGITTEEGLTSTVNETSGTSWGWLYTLLVNIGEAITDGAADIKQAVLGLADSIYNKFTTVLQDIKTGVASLRQDVVTTLGDVKQAVIGIPSKIDDAKQAILGLPSRIAEAVRGLFVPAADWADTFVSTLYNTFADRVGVLTYPLAVAENFLLRFLSVSVGEPVVSWPSVREPFSQQILIQAGSYNFSTLLDDEQIARVYEVLQLVLKAGMAFALFDLCRKKYNTIIHGGAT